MEATAGEDPSVTLEVPFERDDASISPQALPQLTALGEALRSEELKNCVITIALLPSVKDGSIELTQRRALAIRDFLVETFDLNSENLIAVRLQAERSLTPMESFRSEIEQVTVKLTVAR
jgi:hypothetical protein